MLQLVFVVLAGPVFVVDPQHVFFQYGVVLVNCGVLACLNIGLVVLRGSTIYITQQKLVFRVSHLYNVLLVDISIHVPQHQEH